MFQVKITYPGGTVTLVDEPMTQDRAEILMEQVIGLWNTIVPNPPCVISMEEVETKAQVINLR